MSALAEKLRKARTLEVRVGGFVFYVLRPTPLEREEKLRNNTARGILSLIVGWEGVTELAMGLAGGSPHPLAFDSESCSEWLSDRPDLFNPIAKAVVDRFEAYLVAQEEALKN